MIFRVLRPLTLASATFLVAWAVACAPTGGQPAATMAATPENAKTFLDTVNGELLRLGIESSQAGWVYSTYITDDTEALNARTNQVLLEASKKWAKDAARFDGVTVPADQRRMLDLLKLQLELVPPSDPKESEEVTKLASKLEAMYGKGKWCKDPSKPDTCLDIEKITDILATSRDEKRLREVWEGWHTISVPMRGDYTRFVELGNKGAKELGFADMGDLWRLQVRHAGRRLHEGSRSPMGAGEAALRLAPRLRSDEAAREVRRRGAGERPDSRAPHRQHLGAGLGQRPRSRGHRAARSRRISLTDILKRRKTNAMDMVKYGERFYTSLGLAPLPKTFWERSLFTKPADRDVVCHASAWDIDYADDVRIKMCIDPTEEDFTTIHHELGHNFYQRAYKDQPVIFRDGANQAFHEAIGDTIALSVTPEYLVKIGLLDKAPDASGDIGLLLSRALEKIAFLPFGLVIDQWRWDVFSAADSAIRLQQGLVGPASEVPGRRAVVGRGARSSSIRARSITCRRTTRTRATSSRTSCSSSSTASSRRSPGCTTPLHRCSIYDSKAAGKRLDAMLKMGISRPWPDALEALTGSRQMDATAIVDYFAPLKKWLDEQIKGKPVGW